MLGYPRFNKTGILFFLPLGKGAYLLPFSKIYPLFNLCIPLKMSIFVYDNKGGYRIHYSHRKPGG